MSALILTEHIYVMARIALSNGPLLVELISVTAMAQKKAETELWDGLLDQWWRRVSQILKDD